MTRVVTFVTRERAFSALPSPPPSAADDADGARDAVDEVGDLTFFRPDDDDADDDDDDRDGATALKLC